MSGLLPSAAERTYNRDSRRVSRAPGGAAQNRNRVTIWPSPMNDEQVAGSYWPGQQNTQRWTHNFDSEAKAARLNMLVPDTLFPSADPVHENQQQWPGQNPNRKSRYSRYAAKQKRQTWMAEVLDDYRGDEEDKVPIWNGAFDVEKRDSYISRESERFSNGFNVEKEAPRYREPLTKEQLAQADKCLVSVDVLEYDFPGYGTEDDPYLVSWMETDPANPMKFPQGQKYLNATILAIAVWTVSVASSGFSQGTRDIKTEFNVDNTVALLLTSAFVMGFAVGALILSPLSEVFGRKQLYLWTYAGFVVMSGVVGLVSSVPLLVFIRFLGGLAGSFTQAVAPAVIADMFAAQERGFILALFTLAGLMGQMLGPIFCGFLDAAFGWRSLAVFIAGLALPTWIAMMCTFPETYAPALLTLRAKRMQAITGRVHVVDGVEPKKMMTQLKVGAMRPWVILVCEPIVTLLSLFLSAVQGTMFLLFAAYPIVFETTRGWKQGVASLPFLAVALGIVFALFYAALFDQKRYANVVKKSPNGAAPPEARLPPAMLGSVALPIGLFWFAWTNAPETFWLISVSAGVFIGFGMVLLYMSLTNYIVDAYLGYAASALAATTVVRSIAGAAFPLFTGNLYDALGIHWASSVPGFLACVFVPCLVVFYKYGHIIRSKTKFAQEAARMAEAMNGGGK